MKYLLSKILMAQRRQEEGASLPEQSDQVLHQHHHLLVTACKFKDIKLYSCFWLVVFPAKKNKAENNKQMQPLSIVGEMFDFNMTSPPNLSSFQAIHIQCQVILTLLHAQ